MPNDDDIPVLTDPVARAGTTRARPSSADLERLEARVSASSLELAEELLRDAWREAEHVVVERVMEELRRQLPAIVSRALNDHFNR